MLLNLFFTGLLLSIVSSLFGAVFGLKHDKFMICLGLTYIFTVITGVLATLQWIWF